MVITLRADGDDLLVAGLDQAEAEQRLIPYLALDEDYAAIQEQFRRNTQLAQAVDYARGIPGAASGSLGGALLLHHQPEQQHQAHPGHCGNPLQYLGENRCPGGAVPSPDRRCWRPSPRKNLQRCSAGSGPSISWMPPAKPPQAKWIWTMWPPCPPRKRAAELCRIRGVGIKVAHCALLYGFHRIECLPVDVWMKRVMSTMYPQGLPEELLPYAGIAQQYLFHYSRSHPELFEA